MGFENGTGTDADCAKIVALIPQLRVRTQEIRQWTVRRNGPIVEPRPYRDDPVPVPPTQPGPPGHNLGSPPYCPEPYEFEPFDQFGGGEEDLATGDFFYQTDFMQPPACDAGQCAERPDSKSDSSPGPCA
jgi:hypothetical protein